MSLLFKSDWSKITAKGDKTVEIDIEGIIGFDWWDDDEDIIKSKEAMKSELKVISEIKATHINVNINSPGGDVAHGFSMHDLLASHEAEVTTKINGLTASAATIIAQSGDIRQMSDNALYLVHNSMAMTFGNKNDFKSIIKGLEKVDDRMSNLYAKRSGETKESFQDLMDSNNGQGEWINAKEAEEAGLIDEVFEPMAIAAIEINHKKYGYPEYKNKFANLKKPIMENKETVETTEKEVKSLLDRFKALLTPKAEVVEVKEEVSDEDIQAIADLTKKEVDAVSTEKDVEIQALKEANEKESKELKAKIAKLEATGNAGAAGDENFGDGKEVPECSTLGAWQLGKFQNRYGIQN